jgi:hypothetical protein
MRNDEIAAWRKSSYSGANGECVEAAPDNSATAVRDSKDPSVGRLTIEAAAWAALTDILRG